MRRWIDENVVQPHHKVWTGHADRFREAGDQALRDELNRRIKIDDAQGWDSFDAKVAASVGQDYAPKGGAPGDWSSPSGVKGAREAGINIEDLIDEAVGARQAGVGEQFARGMAADTWQGEVQRSAVYGGSMTAGAAGLLAIMDYLQEGEQQAAGRSQVLTS